MELKIYDSGIELSYSNWDELYSKYDVFKATIMGISRYTDTVTCKGIKLYKFKGFEINKAVGISLPNTQVYYCKVKDLNVFARRRKIGKLLK